MITLISETKSQNQYGVYESTYTRKNVYAAVNSASAKEFFEGGKIGIRPDFRMTVFGGDYDGEEVLEYDGKLYSIYRTYQSGTDLIELYVEARGGTDGKEVQA